jgi:hypothetical protein
MQQFSGAGIVLGGAISCDLQCGETALCTMRLIMGLATARTAFEARTWIPPGN